MLVRILLMVDRPQLAERIQRLLDMPDILVSVYGGDRMVVEQVAQETPDLVLTTRDRLWGNNVAGAVAALRHLEDRPEVVILRDDEDPDERARLLAAGSCAVVCLKIADSSLRSLLARLVERRAEAMLATLNMEKGRRTMRLADFVSASPAMQAFLETVFRVVDTDASLLILGETGVGKEHLARAIHQESRRGDGPFVSVNCGALPEQLLESELFGHEEGAYTGATRATRGQFEVAHRGTLFLDEIGDMPIHLQVKLLTVLERRQIRRVGGERPIDIDVRVLAATNRDLQKAMATGEFRPDLYYRLGALALTIPPLRERVQDIPELVESYLGHFRVSTGRGIQAIAPAALETLTRYDWPGNVRELINVIERAVLLCRGGTITVDDLPPGIGGERRPEPPAVLSSSESLPVFADRPLAEARRLAVDDFETAYFTELLKRTRGRIGETARLAGITTRSLYDRLQRLGLRKEDFR